MSFVTAMNSSDNTKVGATKVGVNGTDVYTESCYTALSYYY